jgi:hypothetical protein
MATGESHGGAQVVLAALLMQLTRLSSQVRRYQVVHDAQ